MKVTPYTTKTGIQIGCNYQPKQTWEPSADMETLQTSLIDPSYRSSSISFWDVVLWTVSVIAILMLIIGVHHA
jgi:hypothetical protein